MRRLELFLVAGLVGSFLAHAEEPATVAAPAPSAATSPAAVPASAAPAQTAEPAAPAAAAAQGNATTKLTPPPAEFHPPSGYKATKQGLTTVYCTSVKPVGSNLPRTKCLTKEQIELLQQQEAATGRNIAQKSRECAGQCGAD